MFIFEFVASEFVTWMIQILYLSDRESALEMGRLLQDKGIISCVYVPPASEAASPFIDPKKERFSDNNSLWVMNQLSLQTQMQSTDKNVKLTIFFFFFDIE